MNQENIRHFREAFESSEDICEIISPGRINLIGEHTDYNGGMVLPCAIGQHIRVLLAPNGTDACRVFSKVVGNGLTTFQVRDIQPAVQPGMVGYLMGVVYGLQQSGWAPEGFDLMLESTIPAGAGLSSSAALCCGVGFALTEAFGLDVPRTELARIAQQAEHLFAGVKCGLMDQYAVLFGKEHHALLLDCRSLVFEHIPLDLTGYELVLADSRVHHELASSAYNDRRAACEHGVAIMAASSGKALRTLRDAHAAMLQACRQEMRDEVFRRCAFVLGEMDRTQRAAEFLRAGALLKFGELMYQTHEGLSREYEVSCAETDALVEMARASGVVVGSRMMGGGFGGCTLNLIQEGQTDAFQDFVAHKYLARFGKEPHFYKVSACSGVRRV